MNSKLKEIFLMGFMWGIPFWLFISAIRWAENKPPAFGSLSIFLLISIIGGLCVGLISYKPNSNKIKRTTKKFITSALILISVFATYLIILKLILVPKGMADSFLNTALLISLILIPIVLEKRLYKQKFSSDVHHQSYYLHHPF